MCVQNWIGVKWVEVLRYKIVWLTVSETCDPRESGDGNILYLSVHFSNFSIAADTADYVILGPAKKKKAHNTSVTNVNILKTVPCFSILFTYDCALNNFVTENDCERYHREQNSDLPQDCHLTVCLLDRWPQIKYRVTIDTSFGYSFSSSFTCYPSFCFPW